MTDHVGARIVHVAVDAHASTAAIDAAKATVPKGISTNVLSARRGADGRFDVAIVAWGAPADVARFAASNARRKVGAR